MSKGQEEFLYLSVRSRMPIPIPIPIPICPNVNNLRSYCRGRTQDTDAREDKTKDFFNSARIKGPAMKRNILKKNRSVMYRSSVRPLTQDQIQSPTEKKEREEFDIAVEKKFGPSMDMDDFKDDPDYADFVTPTYDFYEVDEVSSSKMPDIDDIKEEHDVDTPYDQYVGAHVRVPIGNEIRSGKVVRRERELDGTVRGQANAK
jgi:hypothetical protein